jgi:UDPglucose 6-dehydrogenase
LTISVKHEQLPVIVRRKVMNISIVGTGYVGLVTAIGLAMNGNHVTCIDCDGSIVNRINQAVYPFYEASLDGLLESCVRKNHTLNATGDYSAIRGCDASFICVGTFSAAENATSFRNIVAAATQIGSALQETNDYHLVVVKSTVPPGTTEEVIIPTIEKYSGKKAGIDFGVAVNPEFIQEGNANRSALNPDRIVIGGYDQKAGDTLQSLYESFYSGPIVRTGMRAAEMIKYASNAYLATRVTFINEIGNICKKLGIDVYEVAKGMSYDPRIGNKFLNAGIGFGGSCLPKDLKELVDRAQQAGEEALLLSSVICVNNEQPLKLVKMAEENLGNLENKTIAVLGIAFKAGTDDVRDAASLKIINSLLEKGARIKVYDPQAMPRIIGLYNGRIIFSASAYEAIDDADCVLIVTDWYDFMDESLYAGKTVIDGRRVLDPKTAVRICKHYEGVCW